MKFEKLSYKFLFTIFFFALAGIIFFLKIGGKTTKVSAIWWDDSWDYRRSISVTNTSGVGQTNAIVKVLDNYDISSLVAIGKVQSDLDDLRFTDTSGNLVNYWIQDATNSSVDIWVIIPSLSSSGINLWMYYSNSSATSTSTPLYTYTGSSQFIDDGNSQFRVKFLTSGTFTVTTTSTYDSFLVGGGGGTAVLDDSTHIYRYGSGAGGGWTSTNNDISVIQGTSYSIIVGAGGTYSGMSGLPGGDSSAFGYSAAGGRAGSRASGTAAPGGDGGSGGGGYYYAGGTDGADGVGTYGGDGQGTTTREFSEVSGTLYATGGWGGTYHTYGQAGAANTGNGGSSAGPTAYLSHYNGGSGIVVIRYSQLGSSTGPSSDEQYKAPPIAGYCLVEESENDSQLSITWADIASDEDGYLVQRSLNGGAWTDLSSFAANSTSYIDTSTSSNNTYQYRITPYFTGSSFNNWCYTTTFNLGTGNFDLEGLDLEGVNFD